MTWLVRFFVFVVLFTVVRAVLSHLFGWNRGKPTAQRQKRAAASPSMRSVNHRVVKDPVCGTYVDQGLALPLHSGEETLFFCSEECREAYSKKVSAGVR